MAVIHAPGVCRYTVMGTVIDRPFANIIDIEIDTSLGTGTRSDAIWAIAGDILNNYYEIIAENLVPEVTFEAVRWVDLDAIDGETGERTSTSEHTLPLSGNSTGDIDAGSISMLVKKNLVGSARNARSGRMYIPGLGAAGIENNQLSEATHSVWQTRMSQFHENITDEALIYDFTVDMCVVHTPGISEYGEGTVYEATSTHVSNLTVERRLATQRRRLRG